MKVLATKVLECTGVAVNGAARSSLRFKHPKHRLKSKFRRRLPRNRAVGMAAVAAEMKVARGAETKARAVAVGSSAVSRLSLRS